MDLVTIAQYTDYLSAHILKSRLEDEGIHCVLKDEHTVTMNWMWSNALGGIKVLVLEKDAELATQIMTADKEALAKQQDTDAFLDEDISPLDPQNRICIYCGSKNTKKLTINKTWAYTAMLFLGFPIKVNKEQCHCFHCGKTF